MTELSLIKKTKLLKHVMAKEVSGSKIKIGTVRFSCAYAYAYVERVTSENCTRQISGFVPLMFVLMLMLKLRLFSLVLMLILVLMR